MSEQFPSEISDSDQSLTARLEKLRELEELNSQRRKIPIQHIAEALIKAGYTSLDEQTKALGLSRSTAWTIVKTKHKLGRLNTKTMRCILTNPKTPVSIRAIIHSILDLKN